MITAHAFEVIKDMLIDGTASNCASGGAYCTSGESAGNGACHSANRGSCSSAKGATDNANRCTNFCSCGSASNSSCRTASCSP